MYPAPFVFVNLANLPSDLRVRRHGGSGLSFGNPSLPLLPPFIGDFCEQ